MNEIKSKTPPEVSKTPVEAVPGDEKEKPEKSDAETGKASGEQGVRVKKSGVAEQSLRAGRDNTRDETHFQKDTRYMTAARLPEKLGHKIEVKKQWVQPDKQTAEYRTQLPERQPPARLPPHLAERLARRPDQAVYRGVLQERALRGLYRESPLYHKLVQQAQKFTHSSRSPAQGAEAETLKQGELVQLFRMRNKVEQKERFRQMMKYEMARARQEQAQKVQMIRRQVQAKESRHRVVQTQLKASLLEGARQRIAARLQNTYQPSKFEQILQKLMSGQKAVPQLSEGVRARFAAKTSDEWNAFFKTILHRGSELVPKKGEISRLIDAFYRGWFKKTETGQDFLVADLALSDDGEVAENRFSQIELTDKDFLQILEHLKPGDVISTEILKKLGSEFGFLKLVHMVQLAQLTDEQKQEILRQYRLGQSAESQRKMEVALFGERQKNQERQTSGHDQPFVYAGHLFDSKLRHPGRHRFFMYMLYGIVGFTVALVLFLLLRAVF